MIHVVLKHGTLCIQSMTCVVQSTTCVDSGLTTPIYNNQSHRVAYCLHGVAVGLIDACMCNVASKHCHSYNYVISIMEYVRSVPYCSFIIFGNLYINM